jgi:hypothetical protein
VVNNYDEVTSVFSGERESLQIVDYAALIIVPKWLTVENRDVKCTQELSYSYKMLSSRSLFSGAF